MWFSKSKRPTPVTVALTRARAVLSVFDEELVQLAADLRRPGDVRARAAAQNPSDVDAVERSLVALEQSRDEATKEASAWRYRAELAAAGGRDDLGAQARERASTAEAAASAYAAEINAIRALLDSVVNAATDRASEV